MAGGDWARHRLGRLARPRWPALPPPLAVAADEPPEQSTAGAPLDPMLRRLRPLARRKASTAIPGPTPKNAATLPSGARDAASEGKASTVYRSIARLGEAGDPGCEAMERPSETLKVFVGKARSHM